MHFRRNIGAYFAYVIQWYLVKTTKTAVPKPAPSHDFRCYVGVDSSFRTHSCQNEFDEQNIVKNIVKKCHPCVNIRIKI